MAAACFAALEQPCLQAPAAQQKTQLHRLDCLFVDTACFGDNDIPITVEALLLRMSQLHAGKALSFWSSLSSASLYALLPVQHVESQNVTSLKLGKGP